MILFIDNYDSFIYNLARYVVELGFSTKICRNDAITIPEIVALNPSHIILSPGPCTPNDAGICLALMDYFSGKIPILGVCLGHQIIGQAFHAKITRAKRPLHGQAALITRTSNRLSNDLFIDLPASFWVGRYHSLIVSPNDFPACLAITARSNEDEIMALQHRTLPIYGLQFHPESILTEHGYALLQKFLT